MLFYKHLHWHDLLSYSDLKVLPRLREANEDISSNESRALSRFATGREYPAGDWNHHERTLGEGREGIQQWVLCSARRH